MDGYLEYVVNVLVNWSVGVYVKGDLPVLNRYLCNTADAAVYCINGLNVDVAGSVNRKLVARYSDNSVHDGNVVNCVLAAIGVNYGDVNVAVRVVLVGTLSHVVVVLKVESDGVPNVSVNWALLRSGLDVYPLSSHGAVRIDGQVLHGFLAEGQVGDDDLGESRKGGGNVAEGDHTIVAAVGGVGASLEGYVLAKNLAVGQVELDVNGLLAWEVEALPDLDCEGS